MPFQETKKSATRTGRVFWKKSNDANVSSSNDADDEGNKKWGIYKLLLNIVILPPLVFYLIILIFSHLLPELPANDLMPKDYIKKANQENGPWRWQDMPKRK